MGITATQQQITKVDTQAVLVARSETLINAPIDTVWALQTDINRWHEWQPDVVSARLEGDLTTGTIFRWKAAGLNITSTLQIVELKKRIGWTGNALGLQAIHLWEFKAQDNSTWVATEESLSGVMARLLKLFDKKFLEKSLEKSLATLKATAEKTNN